VKCGIDIVDIVRIEKLVSRHDRDKLSRFWTEGEIAGCTDSKGRLKIGSLAARFACKEAVAKALGTGFGKQGVSPEEIEIGKNDSGEPVVILHGKTKAYFEKCGFHCVSVSITHTGDVAAAVCIID
jgi:holo-[acyl-carrier protein] synthase